MKRARAHALDLPPRVRAGMMALGLIPAIHLGLVLLPAALWTRGSVPSRHLWVTAVLLYLLPPLVVRLFCAWWPLPAGRVAVDDPGFLAWWFTAQWQAIFVRLPFLEELLRLVPGLYSLWLRLWGARIGSIVFWAPGVTILDRPLVVVGSRVVFGVGVRLNPHVIAPLPDGRVGLHIGPVSIGDDALIGGYSMLLPGSVVPAGAVTRPFWTVRRDASDPTSNSQLPTPTGK